ncbi:MAG: 50S ribosomal protein L31 [Patescibacteria group bacterium]|nr:50S ribosomal protein L31 [Patescibacteria group bacterium]
MKKGIHPKYYNDCKVACTCGNAFVTGSTVPEIKVEICAVCHPFYTGQSKYIDTEGRIERFERKRQTATTLKVKLAKKKAKKAKREDKKAIKTGKKTGKTQTKNSKKAKPVKPS